MDYTTPAPGEVLWLPDGRPFLFTEITPANGGSHKRQWWKATSEAGDIKLQGNGTLRRRGLTGGWTLE